MTERHAKDQGAATSKGSSKGPTIREVAKLANVSPMTVSRTLAGQPGVRPEARQRVLDAVETLGYRRNENARSLRPGQTSGLVGVAITNLANPYYGELALGVEDVAAAHGRRILLGSTSEDVEREAQLVADFLGRQVEGLIVVPVGKAVDHLQPENLRRVPMVLASRAVEGVSADSVRLDDAGGAYLATRALFASGPQRVAFVGNDISVSTAERRYEGFVRALKEAGTLPQGELIHLSSRDPERARSVMDDMLDSDRPPTAVFCANNRNAIGVVTSLVTRLRSGVLAPEDTPLVASFDDFELSDAMPFEVIVVNHDARELGRRAATMLFERMADPPLTDAPRVVELPVEIRRVGGR